MIIYHELFYGVTEHVLGSTQPSKFFQGRTMVYECFPKINLMT